jgi:integrase
MSLESANSRLKNAGVSITLELKSGKITLRGTFPPKPGSVKTKPYQQRLHLRLDPTPSGIRQAEKEARKIAALIDCKEFDWKNYRSESTEKDPEPFLLEDFHQFYLSKGGSENTWKTDYLVILKKLNTDPTIDSLTQLVLNTAPNTRTRKRACIAVTALAKYLKLDLNVTELRGNYSPFRSVKQRTIPTDQQIAETRHHLPEPWQWIYGMMATYGLRNHEVFRLDLAEFPIVQILDDTKTGFRECWPCHPQWAESWNLVNPVLPNVALMQENSDLGHRVTVQFNRSKIPFAPYDLRHAWAIRTLEYGWPVEFSAHMMGHSLAVHTQIYGRWITREKKQQIFDLLISRKNGITPPI